MNPEIENFKSFTIKELQDNFDNIIGIVESGKCVIITSENGNVLMVPYKEVVDTYDDAST